MISFISHMGKPKHRKKLSQSRAEGARAGPLFLDSVATLALVSPAPRVHLGIFLRTSQPGTITCFLDSSSSLHCPQGVCPGQPLSTELTLRGPEGDQQQEMEAEGMRGGESQGPEQPTALGHWAQTPSYSLSSPTLLVTLQVGPHPGLGEPRPAQPPTPPLQGH